MTVPNARRHRLVFLAAGCYNLVWGGYAVADPQWLFRFAGMAPLQHPQIFATLGMVLALYGILYLDVARRPDHGFLIAAVGLTGKVVGPAGWCWLALTGQWPLASGLLILTNDLIWWVPFALYLRDAWPSWRDSQPEPFSRRR